MSNAPDVPLLARLIERLTASRTLPDPLPPDPFPIFHRWFDEAKAAKAQPNPDAMSLATVDADGTPSVRMLLCRGIDDAAGTITFYTNYLGRKGRALEANPRVAACLHWDQAERQARIEGTVVRATPEQSDAYFNQRPWESRLGAWASHQSEPLGSRAELVARVLECMKQLGISPAEIALKGNGVKIPRPAHWGGFTLLASRVELWLGGPGRFHDRAAWTREFRGPAGVSRSGGWSSTRLQP